MYFKKAIDAMGYIPPVELAKRERNQSLRSIDLRKAKNQNNAACSASLLTTSFSKVVTEFCTLGIHMFIPHLLTSMLYKDIILKNLVGVVQWHPGMKKDKE